MALTPEQLDQIREAKAKGAKRATLNYTSDQRASWLAEVEVAQNEKDANIAHFLKIQSAAEQAGFFGDVRRAILASRRPTAELAQAVGIDIETLSDFRAGDRDLPADALDRLVEALGLRLMQYIPK